MDLEAKNLSFNPYSTMVKNFDKVPVTGRHASGSASKSNGLLRVRHPADPPAKKFITICGSAKFAQFPLTWGKDKHIRYYAPAPNRRGY